MNSRKINFIYEFETPFGYLPMGYNHKDIPLIFDYFNNRVESSRENMVVYFGKAGFGDKFSMLSLASDIYFNFDDNFVERKHISDLTDDEIKDDINIFTITPTHNQTIVSKILSESLDDCFLDISKKTLKENENFKVVIIDNKEGGFDYPNEFFKRLNRFSLNLNLKESQLVFITNTSNIDEIYKKYLTENNQDSFMRCDSIHFYIYDEPGDCIMDYFGKSKSNKDMVSYDEIYYSVPYEDEIKNTRENYFLCMNRNSDRLHRVYLVNDLIENKLFDKGLISLFESKNLNDLCKNNTQIKKNICDAYPFFIDYTDKNFVSGMHNFFNTKDSWLNSYFSIVNETTVSDKHIFITEKCIRPMIYFHPFIIYGNPNILKHLRNLGFETFPEFFDESYDDELDKVKRRKMIVKAVKNLCDKSLDEMHELYQSVIPKLIHNRRLLIKMAEESMRTKRLIKILSDGK